MFLIKYKKEKAKTKDKLVTKYSVAKIVQKFQHEFFGF